MKIVFLLNTMDFGGAERTVLALADYFKNDYDVSILCMSGSSAFEIPEGINLINLNIKDSFNNGIERIINAFSRTLSIRKTIRQINPDIVYCIMGINAKYLIGDFNRKYKLFVSERSNPKLYDEKTKKWLNRIYNKCDGIVFQTKRVSDLYPDLPDGKKTIIPNAVSNKAAYELSWEGRGSKRISAIGRLVTEKDYPTLLEAFSIFLKDHKDYVLEIYGDGDERSKIQGIINDKGLDQAVVLKGSRPDALECASQTECYVLSSICEGMPNTLMEAMAIGMPCVSTDCEYGPAELIVNEKNGLLVECKAPEQLAMSLSRMTDDDEFASKCSANAFKDLKKHSILSIGIKYKEFFRAILEGKK